jgi:hypothetical protein
MTHGLMAVPTLSPLRRVTEGLVALGSGRRALASVVVFLVFSATVLPWQAGIARAYSEGVGSPDSSFFYTRDQLYAFAEAFGADGRSSYVLARVTFDVVWPLVYGAMLVLVIGWLLQRSTDFGAPPRFLVLLPVIAVLADYAENTCTAIVMARWPETTDVLASLAGVFTATKWTTLSLAFLAVPIVAIGALLRGRRARAERRDSVYYR